MSLFWWLVGDSVNYFAESIVQSPLRTFTLWDQLFRKGIFMSQETQASSSNAAQINTMHKVFAGNCVVGVLLVCVCV